MERIKRIHLLSTNEIADLYGRPEFNAGEQQLYFSLSKAELNALNQYTNTKTRVYFILQLGYFKAKQQFYNFDYEEAVEDTQFILNMHFKDSKLKLSGRLSRDSTRSQKQTILFLFNYSDWSVEHEAKIESHICRLLRYYPKSHSALRQLLGYFDNQKIVSPSYRKLQVSISCEVSKGNI